MNAPSSSPIRDVWVRIQAFWGASTRNKAIMGGISGLLVVCAICSCLSIAIGAIASTNAHTSSNSTQQQTARATSISTHTPLPTAVMSPTPIPPIATATSTTRPVVASTGSTVIGGALSAFVSKFGQPNNNSDPSSGRYNFGNNNFLMITTAGFNASGHIVETIAAASPTKQPMDPTTGKGYCQTFLPSDAHYQRQQPVTDSSGLEGIDYIYFSNSVANSGIPSSDFTDANGDNVKPGTFDMFILYSAPNDSAQIDSCSIDPGTSQAT